MFSLVSSKFFAMRNIALYSVPKAQGAPGSKIVSIYIMHKNLNSIKFPSRAYRPKTLSDFLIYVVGISSGDLVNVEV